MPHSKQRYLFIDLLRFLAVVIMIQGHTFDAMLDVELRSSRIFFIHDFFHGFVAPMFLFASGVAFGISTFKKWEEHIVPNQRVAKRIGKFIGLLLIGYALHLPFFSLRKILYEATAKEIAVWLQVDALHCIASTMLFLQLSVLALKQEKRFVRFVGAAAALIIVFAPIMWSMDVKGIFPLWFASYLNSSNSSWFPWFPWSAYILSGVFFSWLFINAKEHHHTMKLMQNTVAAGVAVFITALILVNLPFNVYPAHDVWKSNPLIFFARLGFVIVVTSSIFFAEHSIKIPSKIPQIMGRESLFIYVVHLVIIYGSVMNKGLQHLFFRTLSVVQSSLIFLLLFFVIVGFTYGWYQFKKHYKRTATVMRFAAAGIFIILFIVRPY